MKNAVDEEIGARVRAVREQSGMTQLDITLKAGASMPPSRVSRLERGSARWTVALVRQFAELLGVSVSSLMGEDESDTAAA